MFMQLKLYINKICKYFIKKNTHIKTEAYVSKDVTYLIQVQP